jgi:putative nucleotidyltransferase with HDIG domain
MDWLLPSIAVDFGFKLAVCLILFMNYFESNEKFILYWAIGWALFALSIFFEFILAYPTFHFSPFTISFIFFLKHASWALMGVVFLKSILVLKNITAHVKMVTLALLAVLSAFLGTFIISDWFWAALPSSFINGFSLIICALYFRRLKPEGPALGNQLIFYGFLLNGLHNLDYPFLRPIEQFAPWGFAICAILTIVFAVGLIMRSGLQVRSHRISALESAKELSALYAVSSIVSRTPEIDKVFDEILKKIADVLNMDTGILYLLDEKKNLLIPRAHFNIPSIMKGRLSRPLKLTEGWTGRVAQSGEMKIVSDATISKDAWPETKKSGLKTFISLPIKTKKKIIGVVEFGSYLPRIFSQDEIHLLSSIANEVAIAIENVKLYNSVKKTAKELGTLHSISLAMTNYLDMDKMLNEILRKVVATLNIEAGVIYIIDHKSHNLILRSHTGLSDEFIESVRMVSLDSGTLTAQVAKTKKPVFVEDISIYPTSKQVVVKKEGLYGYCGIPIRSARDKMVGVLVVTTHKIRKFTDEEVQLLTLIANEIGTAVESGKLYEDLQDVYLRSITALAEVVDAKDHYTYSHSKYVTTYAVKIAREMSLPDKEIEDVRKACQLHDIGKISISDYILNKKKKLNKEEWEEIKKHPLKGASMLEPLTFLKEPDGGGVIELIKQHHERYDGKGYPRGIKGEKIKLGARIMAVADAYHAMISTRPYRKALTQKKAIEELKRCAGTQFDPKVVEAFLKILAKEKKYAETKS